MKTKLALTLFASLLVGAGTVLAGPSIGVSVGRAPICPPAPVCVRPIYRSYPVSALCPQPAIYSWGPSVVVYSNVAANNGFSNISPVMNYGTTTPIYRVPAPVIPAQPVIIYPTGNFGWKR